MATTPDDERFNLLWGMHNTGQRIAVEDRFDYDPGTPDVDIDAPEVWDSYTDSSNVVVAVIDTGVDHTHDDLAENMWVNPGEIAGNGIDDDGNGFIDDIHGWDFRDDDNDPMDDHNHGTHCAGIIGARGNNGIGVAGVSWTARIMAIRFLGAGGGNVSDAIDAIYYAADSEARVVSNSWGGNGYSQLLEEALAYSATQNKLMVMAAGNDGSNNDLIPVYPASYALDNIISVAAIDRWNKLAEFSNYGRFSVDIAAPGVTIFSTIVQTEEYGYAGYSGTSMACPHVAGAATLFYSVIGEEAPYSVVKDAILRSGDEVAAYRDVTTSGRRLNLNNLVSGLSNGDFFGLLTYNLDDDNEAGSAGNDSGFINPGETVALDISLFNADTSATGNMTATLSVVSDPDNLLTISDDTEPVGVLEAGAFLELDDAFLLTVEDTVPAAVNEVELLLTVDDGASSFTRTVSLKIYRTWVASGQVVVDGAPVEGALVNFFGPQNMGTTTDASGNFVVEVLEGDYQINAAPPLPFFTQQGEGVLSGYLPNWQWLLSETLELEILTDVTQDFAFETFTATGTVTGADTGQPLSNALVNLRVYFDWLNPTVRSRRVEAITGPGGMYAYTYIIPVGVTDYSTRIWANHADYDQSEIFYPAAGSFTQDVVLTSSRVLAAPVSISETLPAGQSKQIEITLHNAGSENSIWQAVSGLDYTVSSSTDPDGPVFVWNDITNDPAAIELGDWEHDWSQAVAIGFPFRLYETVSEIVRIGESGGLLTLNDPTDYRGHYKRRLPENQMPRSAIIPRRGFTGVRSQDGYNFGQGTVHALRKDTDADGAIDTFIYQVTDIQETKWNPLNNYLNEEFHYTWQVHLKKDGRILIYYKDMPSLAMPEYGKENYYFVSGIQDALGRKGITLDYADYELATVVVSETAFELVPPPHWIRFDKQDGALPEGRSETFTITLDANGLDVGSYQSSIRVFSADGYDTGMTIPVRLEVTYDLEQPVADAGEARTIAAGGVILLDGSRSYDPLGDSLTYQWEQISGPAILTIENADSARALVGTVVDSLEDLGDYVFQLTVSDGTHTAMETVTVTVEGFNVALYKEVSDNFRDTDSDGPDILTDGIPFTVVGFTSLQTWINGPDNVDGYTRIDIDLAGTYAVNRVRMQTSGTRWLRPYGYIIQGWDNERWTTLVTVEDVDHSDEFTRWIDLDLPAGTVISKLRFQTTENEDTLYFYEFELLGVPGSLTPVANQPPVADDLAFTLQEGENLSFSLRATDADGDELSYAIQTQPVNGILLGAEPTFSYVPVPGFSGTETLYYTAYDRKNTSNVASVTITVTPVNEPPVALFDRIWSPDGLPVVVDVLANDSDPDGDPISLTSFTQGAHGTVSQVDSSVFEYTPDTGWEGRDTFTYTLQDEHGNEQVGTVYVYTGDPVMRHYPVTETSGTTLNDVSGKQRTANLRTAHLVAGHPFNPNDGREGTPELEAGMGHDGGAAVYFDGFAGYVEIPGGSDLTGSPVAQRTISFWVKPGAIPNRDYYALNLLYEEGNASQGLLIGMDFHGVLRVANWDTSRGLDYENNFQVDRMASANLAEDVWQHITVVLDAGPTPTENALKLYIDGKWVDSTYGVEMDYRGGSVGLGGLSGTTGTSNFGDAHLLENTFEGDLAAIRIYDWGLEPDEIASLASTGTLNNTAPVARDLSFATLTKSAVGLLLEGTDADPGDTLYYEIVEGPVNGTLSGTGQLRTYTPDTSFKGTDTLRYRVSDGQAYSNTATVMIHVVSKNTVPVADAGGDVSGSGGIAALDGSASTDADGHVLSYAWQQVGGPSTLTITHADQAIATVSSSVSGEFIFRLTVSDGISSDSDFLTLSLDQPLEIIANPINAAFAGRAFGLLLLARGGTGDYQWSISSGLPGWLGLDATAGLLRGVPGFSDPYLSILTLEVTDGVTTVSTDLHVQVSGSANIDLAQWQALTGVSGDASLTHSDADGVVDLLEWALGGNPTRVDEVQLPAIGLSPDNRATFTYRRRIGQETAYFPEISADFSGWSDASLMATEIIDLGNGFEEVTLTMAEAIHDGEQPLMRLIIVGD
ncbi:MAG: S8 family serine peptidase [Puniceicoccaceae bacterium]